MDKKKILFACTFHGARSLIACAMAKRYSSEEFEAHCGCFEKGNIGPKIFDLIVDAGLVIDKDNVPSIFERIENSEKFDYVVMMCNPESKEHCDTVYDALKHLVESEQNIIQWSVDDFLSLSGEGERWNVQAKMIVADIKQQVFQLTTDIEEHRL